MFTEWPESGQSLSVIVFVDVSLVLRAQSSSQDCFHLTGGQAKHSPHCGAVEVDHQPLAGVEGDGVGELDAFHPLSKLGTHEGGTSVGSVHVQPELFLLRREICDFLAIRGENNHSRRVKY